MQKSFWKVEFEQNANHIDIETNRIYCRMHSLGQRLTKIDRRAQDQQQGGDRKSEKAVSKPTSC